jgi:hypothetical protein
MNVRTASLCVVASPLLCLVLDAPIRGQSFEGPISFDGSASGGVFGGGAIGGVGDS